MGDITFHIETDVNYKNEKNIIMFFKRFRQSTCSNEIKLQEGINGIDNILCKTDFNKSESETDIQVQHLQRYTLRSMF